MIRILISACLLGSPVRPDGGDKKLDHPVIRRWLEEGRIVSVCPEVLGGLPTPRPPAEIAPGGDARRVVTRDGVDVTPAFEAGAHIVAAQADANRIRVAILKDGSPSCGSSTIHDGNFRGNKIAGEGVTAALLRARGITVFSEDEIDAAAAFVAGLETRV